jgi:hypothetical protein
MRATIFQMGNQPAGRYKDPTERTLESLPRTALDIPLPSADDVRDRADHAFDVRLGGRAGLICAERPSELRPGQAVQQREQAVLGLFRIGRRSAPESLLERAGFEVQPWAVHVFGRHADDAGFGALQLLDDRLEPGDPFLDLVRDQNLDPFRQRGARSSVWTARTTS